MGDSSAKMREGYKMEHEFMMKVRQCGGFDIEHLMKTKPGCCNLWASEITKDKPAPEDIVLYARKMTNDNNHPIDTIDVTTTPLNVAATDATVTTVGNITASTAAATTSTILPAGNTADETTCRSLFGAGLYQTEFNRIEKRFNKDLLTVLRTLKMTNDNNTPIDVTTTPLNVPATNATVTTVGNITALTAAATTSTILPAGNAADETTRRSLFGAGLY
ncbi:hypothetical protein F2Q69_00025497 [Brassica cretica]|uniref:Uncharacterized protein n=1 Tax=Brassica cretica TaxID=69181 RepID=A0A8S9QNI8_BRACR|nr:hypothetical protein F2Q69_00025497 [Brassica cretica]